MYSTFRSSFLQNRGILNNILLPNLHIQNKFLWSFANNTCKSCFSRYYSPFNLNETFAFDTPLFNVRNQIYSMLEKQIHNVKTLFLYQNFLPS